jgi:hypothetical protein
MSARRQNANANSRSKAEAVTPNISMLSSAVVWRQAPFSGLAAVRFEKRIRNCGLRRASLFFVSCGA